MAKIGIDFGTTNSVTAVLRGRTPEPIIGANNSFLLPSVVARVSEGWLVGGTARRQALINPKNTVSGVKRLLGRRLDELDPTRFLFDLVADEKTGMALIKFSDNEIVPPEYVASQIFRKLVMDAEGHLGESVTSVVITQPAYFNESQRRAVRMAAELASLKVDRQINEPTAAGVAYGFGAPTEEKKILVWDLGGGTFDVSIVRHIIGSREVLGTAGDTLLGGDDWDRAISDLIVAHIKEVHQFDPTEDPTVMNLIREESEKAKIALSNSEETTIMMPFLPTGKKGKRPINVSLPLKRAEFTSATAHLIGRLEAPFRQALEVAELKPQDLDEIIMVGGGTLMPMVFDEAARLSSHQPLRISAVQSVVAMGAAIQGGIISSSEVSPGFIVLDVTPLSFRIKRVGDRMKVVLPRGTKLPCQKSETVTTVKDGQTIIEVVIFEGESETAEGNHYLGTLVLSDIPPAPKGTVKIEVTLNMDVNGILTVSAKDIQTGNSRQITIVGSNLPKSEIEKLLKQAGLPIEEPPAAEEPVTTQSPEVDSAEKEVTAESAAN